MKKFCRGGAQILHLKFQKFFLVSSPVGSDEPPPVLTQPPLFPDAMPQYLPKFTLALLLLKYESDSDGGCAGVVGSGV